MEKSMWQGTERGHQPPALEEQQSTVNLTINSQVSELGSVFSLLKPGEVCSPSRHPDGNLNGGPSSDAPGLLIHRHCTIINVCGFKALRCWNILQCNDR